MTLKQVFKRNTHNGFFKALAGFGRSLNRLYENRNHDIYSNGEWTLLKKLAQTNPSLLIDGGANVGHYSRCIQSVIPNCKVYAFEPVESTFEALAENMKSFPSVVPVKKGLYRENGKTIINLYPHSTHSSLIDIRGLPYERTDTAEIELIRGDDFMAEQRIGEVDFLKLDLEGAEYEALLGFEQTIRKGKVRLIQFEFGYINITTKRLLIDFYNFFEPYGYCVGKVFPKTVEFRKYAYKYEDFLGPNYVAVKQSDHQLIQLLEKK